MVSEEKVPKDILVKYIKKDLPDNDWSGVLAKALLQRVGYIK